MRASVGVISTREPYRRRSYDWGYSGIQYPRMPRTTLKSDRTTTLALLKRRGCLGSRPGGVPLSPSEAGYLTGTSFSSSAFFRSYASRARSQGKWLAAKTWRRNPWSSFSSSSTLARSLGNSRTRSEVPGWGAKLPTFNRYIICFDL
ncbi:hypothetical protein LIER_37338 [Lithospermum erythrorhizon]|uniref:Uncharacterized protein n=1 Tax=Lithospermum erythrorhizon TaxID=34254 RepID=A0AAV3PJ41_LITER